MPSLGELFIQLGVVGDVQPLQEALDKAKEQVKVAERQLQLDKLRAKAVEDIRKAQTKSERQGIARRYQQEKAIILQKADIAGKEQQIKAGKALAGNLGAIVTGFTALVGAVAGAAYAINKLTDELTTNNQAWVNFTRTTELGLENLQKYAGVASVLDKSLGMQGAAGSIAQLNDRLFELRLTGEGARGFQLAGIDPRGLDSFGVLERLRDRVAGMDNNAASYLLKQMGLDPRLLAMLRMSREEFEELGQTIQRYQLTEEQRMQIQQMNTQLAVAQQKLQYLKDRAILALMPAVVSLAQSFARVTEVLARMAKPVGNFIIKWRGLIAAFAIGISKNAKVVGALKTFNKPFRNLLAIVLKLTRSIPILGRVFASVAGFITKSLLPVFGIISAIYLLLDDFAVYQNGGKSVLGEFLEWKDKQGEDWKNIGNTFAEGDIGQGLKDLLIKLITTIDNLVQEIAKWLKVITGLPFDKWAQSFANTMSGGTIEKVRNYDYSHKKASIDQVATAGLISPTTNQMIDNINNSTTNSSNTNTIAMTNYIQTDQPAQDITKELYAINQRFAYG